MESIDAVEELNRLLSEELHKSTIKELIRRMPKKNIINIIKTDLWELEDIR